MNKKQKHKSLPQDRRNAKARAAAGAKATAGRARTFADKQDILAKDTGDSEINEGLAEYQEKKAPVSQIRNYSVTVGMVIGLAFDKGEKLPTGERLKQILAENLIDHPAWNDAKELAEFIDDVQLNDTEPA